MTTPNNESGSEWPFKLWRDSFDEWVWQCRWCPDLHGGYSSPQQAAHEAAAHATDEHATRDPELVPNV